MAEILLKIRERIGITVEAEVIRPDAFTARRGSEIEALPVWQGPQRHALSDFFDVDVREDEGERDCHTHRWRCLPGQAHRPGDEGWQD